MMNWIFGLLIVGSVLYGSFSGNISAVSQAALSECENAIQFIIMLLGTMCVWGGFMKIAERSGLTEIISKAFYPLTKRLFPGLGRESAALTAISMNITANLLGLGIAATPLGIAAMKELQKECPADHPHTASHPMILFILLNTASIQILPTTIGFLRAQNGSQAPFDILPSILVTSILSLTVGLLMAQSVKSISERRTVKHRSKKECAVN